MQNSFTLSLISYGLIFAVPFAIAMIDFLVLIRTKRKPLHKHRNSLAPLEQDFNILIPIFGNIRYLKNVDYLARYGSKVILCTTLMETDEFNQKLEAIAKNNQFRIFRSAAAHSASGNAGNKVNPWRLFNHALTRKDSIENQINRETIRDEIILDSFVAVSAKYCVFIDGDTVSEESIDKIVGMFKTFNYDLSSVRVVASKKHTLAEKLQSVEYELAMDARRLYPWLTSGAAMIAKTSVIKDIMSHHSLFFQGGDIEIGKLAKLLGYKVGHLHTLFYTDVPESLKAWAKQRIAWAGGGFRHSIVNLHRYSWRHPMFFLYNTVIVYLLIPVRWYETILHPIVLLYIYLLYLVLIFIFHLKTWRPFYLLFPAYALFQVLFLIPLGVLKYFQMAKRAKNIGHIKLRTQTDSSS